LRCGQNTGSAKIAGTDITGLDIDGPDNDRPIVTELPRRVQGTMYYYYYFF